jgi:DNA-binding transcriptional ArsR family regulator
MSRPLRHRDLKDPRELRALAHPIRVRLMEELMLDGPLTASQLGERVGESPANCSWHLRQLAKYGFVEEAGGGAGRQRPWQVAIESYGWGDQADPEAAAAASAFSQVQRRWESDEYEAYAARRATEPPEWDRAAFWNKSLAWLTADELESLGHELTEIMLRYADRFTDPAARPAGARAVRFLAWGVPAHPWTGEDAR